jgi:Domain of unknown function (DUF3846)
MTQEAKGVVLFTDGTYATRTFKQLKDLQDAVGGLIEIIHLYDASGNDFATAYVNEEGRLLDLPLNPFGGSLSFMLGNNPMLVGNMVVVGIDDGDGNDTDIDEQLLAFIEKVCPQQQLVQDELV